MTMIMFLTNAGQIFGRDYAGYSGSFLRMGTTARSIAMGGGFSAELDRGFTAFHNPAGLPFLKDRHVSFSHQQLPLDRRFIGSAFAMRLPPTAGLGIMWVNAGVNNIDGRTTSGVHTETLSTGENAVYISFAQQVIEWLGVGVSIKILDQQLPMNSSSIAGKGIGFDAGILIKSGEDFAAGIMVQDLNSGYQWNTGSIFEKGMIYEEKFPTQYRSGFRMKKWETDIVGEVAVITDHQSVLGIDVRIGAEHTLHDNYFLRGGIGNSRISVGGGMQYQLFNKKKAFLDYAFRMGAVAGIEHVFTCEFIF